MNKVVTINLNGNAYQVEETGYLALKNYLDTAEVQLTDNPDRVEIMADLEQAIAEKCRKYLAPNKSVVIASEVSQIIAEMGPVDGGSEEGKDSKESAPSNDAEAKGSAPKRLYRIQEGAMLGGVCQGLGAYTHIDPTIIRIVFIGLAFASAGLFVVAYLVLTLVVPEASTSEERAAAEGRPFSAQNVIDDAKRTYEQFRNSKDWKKEWRRQKVAWRRMWRGAGTAWTGNIQQGVGYTARIMGGLMFPLLVLTNIALPIVAIVAIYVLVTNRGTNWHFPLAAPAVVPIILIIAVIGIITAPLRAARRAAFYGGNSSWAMWQLWSGVIGFVGLIAALGFAYVAIPQVHYIINNLPDILDGIFS
jgi:phage shock protein PspC (stress-responsive transcriptional regulator)